MTYTPSEELVEVMAHAIPHLACRPGDRAMLQTEVGQKMVNAVIATLRQDPVTYMCPAGCGCLWRDNKDGSMSLFNGNQKSCSVCEFLPLDKLTPVYSVPPHAA